MKSSLGDLSHETISLPVADSMQQDARYLQSQGCDAVFDALVLDAQLRQSLATVRSLGSRGLRVAALGPSEKLPTFASRWCQRAFVCPIEEGTEAYYQYLEQLLDRVNVRVLITSSDGTISLIRRHREQLEGRGSLALAKESALQIAVSKE